MIDIQALAKQAGARPIHERPKWALCGKKELEAFAALVLEAAAKRAADEDVASTDDAVGVQACIVDAIHAMKPEPNP